MVVDVSGAQAPAVRTAKSAKSAEAAEAAQSFFNIARCAFEQAARPARAERTMLLAGCERLRIRFGSLALAESLAPAFAHLPEAPADGAPADFTIDAWDTAGSGIAMPAPPWREADYGPYGEIRQAGWPRTLRARFNLHSGVLSMVDGTARALWWTRDAAALPDYERGAPFALLLHWWQLLCPPPGRPPACAMHAVHAAAVGTERDGGLLLVGRGGSGKSTTALACLAAGFLYAGDDYCLLQSTPAGPRACSLFATGKLSDAMLARFPVFGTAVVNPQRAPGEKALLFLDRSFSKQLVTGMPLRAIVLPRVFPDREETRLTPASPAAALQALAPSTIFLFPRSGPEAANLLAQLAAATRRLPCFHLELGADADATRTPQILSGLLARIGAGSPL
jgi:hypothetical protein